MGSPLRGNNALKVEPLVTPKGHVSPSQRPAVGPTESETSPSIHTTTSVTSTSTTTTTTGTATETVTTPTAHLKIYHSSHEDYSEAEVASFKLRFLAVVIDGIVLSMLQKAFMFLLKGFYLHLAQSHLVAAVIAAYAVDVILTIYYAAWPLSEWGQTLGKKMMGLKVVSTRPNQSRVTLGQAINREIIGKFVSALAFGWGFIRAYYKKDHLAWHDLYAKTKVIKC